jgi:hypothetical protein
MNNMIPRQDPWLHWKYRCPYSHDVAETKHLTSTANLVVFAQTGLRDDTRPLWRSPLLRAHRVCLLLVDGSYTREVFWIQNASDIAGCECVIGQRRLWLRFSWLSTVPEGKCRNSTPASSWAATAYFQIIVKSLVTNCPIILCCTPIVWTVDSMR